MLVAKLNAAAPGDLVEVYPTNGSPEIKAQVISCVHSRYTLSPLEHFVGIGPGSKVSFVSENSSFGISQNLLGAVINSMGKVIQRNSAKIVDYSFSPEFRHLNTSPPLPLERTSISEAFETGIKAIDGLLTLGRGSRIVVLAEPGVGKSTLLGMLLKHTDAEIKVVALIGERGREVREFVDRHMTSSEAANTICIVSTSDEPPALRIRAATIAMTIAEFFRDHGLNVMLQVDSLTRLLRAYRELGLAAGELPIRKGYPASVFSYLPNYIERAGPKGKGTITAFFTALLTANVEEDPMVEEIISLTDGHISLSHDLARKGHYPAIDVLQSLSRLQHLAGREVVKSANILREAIAVLEEQKDSMLFGAKPSEELTKALKIRADLETFLRQDADSKSDYNVTIGNIDRIVSKLHDQC